MWGSEMTDLLTSLRESYAPDGCGCCDEAADEIERLHTALAAERERVRVLTEALLDATANLAGAASAYRKYAKRYTGITPKAETDAFYSTRVDDFDKATERARAAIRAEPS